MLFIYKYKKKKTKQKTTPLINSRVSTLRGGEVIVCQFKVNVFTYVF